MLLDIVTGRECLLRLENFINSINLRDNGQETIGAWCAQCTSRVYVTTSSRYNS